MFSNGARYVAEFRDSSRSAHGIQTYPSGKCATLCFLTLRESCGASQKRRRERPISRSDAPAA